MRVCMCTHAQIHVNNAGNQPVTRWGKSSPNRHHRQPLLKSNWMATLSLSKRSLCFGTGHHPCTPTEVVGQLDCCPSER